LGARRIEGIFHLVTFGGRYGGGRDLQIIEPCHHFNQLRLHALILKSIEINTFPRGKYFEFLPGGKLEGHGQGLKGFKIACFPDLLDQLPAFCFSGFGVRESRFYQGLEALKNEALNLGPYFLADFEIGRINGYAFV